MIIISAETPSDKGKIFEDFICILLSRLGYQVKNVRVRKSGRELDIQANSKVTGAPILIECKAEAEPIKSKDYNKFYGVYEHEYRRSNSKLTGMMISLSGFNSEVIANYVEKSEEDKQRFIIRGPDSVLEWAVDAQLISNDLTVQHLAKKSWPFELGETLLVITKSQLYRIQLLQRDGRTTHFIAYRANCEDPTDYEITALCQAVPLLKELEPLNLSARKEILLALAKSVTPLSIEALKKAAQQSLVTIEHELTYLKDRNLIEKDGKGQIHLVPDLRSFCEISKEMLNSTLKYDYLLTPFFEKMNSLKLAEYCLSRRFLLPSAEEELSQLYRIFQVSPSALDQALFGEIGRYQVTYEHAKQVNTDIRWLSDAEKYTFLAELIPLLINDLHDGENKVLNNLPSVVGIFEEYHIVLANTWGVLFNIKTGGTSVRLIASEAMQAGQLVTASPMTSFNSAMTGFNLTRKPEYVEEMEQIFRKVRGGQDDHDKLPGMANNIGICYLALEDYFKAQQRFDEGLKYSDDVFQLHSNLATVYTKLGDQSKASYHSARAKELQALEEQKID